MGSLKLSITVHWKPFVGEDIKAIGENLLGDLSAQMAAGSSMGGSIRDIDVVSNVILNK